MTGVRDQPWMGLISSWVNARRISKQKVFGGRCPGIRMNDNSKLEIISYSCSGYVVNTPSRLSTTDQREYLTYLGRSTRRIGEILHEAQKSAVTVPAGSVYRVCSSGDPPNRYNLTLQNALQQIRSEYVMSHASIFGHPKVVNLTPLIRLTAHLAHEVDLEMPMLNVGSPYSIVAFNGMLSYEMVSNPRIETVQVLILLTSVFTRLNIYLALIDNTNEAIKDFIFNHSILPEKLVDTRLGLRAKKVVDLYTKVECQIQSYIFTIASFNKYLVYNTETTESAFVLNGHEMPVISPEVWIAACLDINHTTGSRLNRINHLVSHTLPRVITATISALHDYETELCLYFDPLSALTNPTGKHEVEKYSDEVDRYAVLDSYSAATLLTAPDDESSSIVTDPQLAFISTALQKIGSFGLTECDSFNLPRYTSYLNTSGILTSPFPVDWYANRSSWLARGRRVGSAQYY